jgi:hypothetical protein
VLRVTARDKRRPTSSRQPAVYEVMISGQLACRRLLRAPESESVGDARLRSCLIVDAFPARGASNLTHGDRITDRAEAFHVGRSKK